MMLDDRDLEELFRARASTLPEPPPELFTRTFARIAAKPRRRIPIAALWQRFGLRAELSFAVAIVLLFSTISISLLRQTPNLVPERIEAVKIDRVPPAPKEIKINTLKTNAVAGGPTEHAAPAAQTAAIARTATIALLVRDVPAALAALNRVARADGGLVTALNDSLPSDAGEPHTATLSLLVDARRLDAALAKIAALGAQQSRTAAAEAIGDSIVDDQARLRNLRREEADLLHIMDRSGSVENILDVESKLADVRGQIEQLDAELAGLQHRVATAQIDVTLTEATRTVAPATPTLGDHFSATWSAALRSVVALVTSLADLALWLAAFAPFWIVAAIVAGAIVLRSRSRF